MTQAKQPKPSAPMSLKEVRTLIGYSKGDRSLLRQLEAREVLLGVRFVVRGQGTKRTTYAVTLADLRRYAANLLPDELRGEAAGVSAAGGGIDRSARRLLREAVAELRGEAEDVAVEVILRRVEPRLAALERKVGALERTIQRLRVPPAKPRMSGAAARARK